MKEITYAIIGFAVCLNWSCRLDRLELDCDEYQTFEKKYTAANDFVAYDIQETSDGGYVICGGVYHPSDQDIFLMKINAAGEVLFFEIDRKETTDEVCNSVVFTPDKGFLVCGSSDRKAYFAKYNFEGKRLGDERVELFNNSNCSCITQSGANYVFSGRADNPQINNSYVGTLNLQGQTPNIITHYLPNPRSGVEHAIAVIPSKSGYTVVGHSFNIPGTVGTTMHFYRLNENLQMIPNTEKLYRIGTQQDIAQGVLEIEDGNYLIAGNFHSVNQGEDIFVIKANPNGEILEQYEYGGYLNEGARAITQAHENDQYVIAGYSKSFNTDGSEDVYIVKINSDGSIVWEKTFGEVGIDERGHHVIRAKCGGYIVTGYSEKINGERQVYTVKVDADGNVM